VFPLSDATAAFIRRGVSAAVSDSDKSDPAVSLLLGALGSCRPLLPHLVPISLKASFQTIFFMVQPFDFPTAE
jgi:hypothetical protein